MGFNQMNEDLNDAFETYFPKMGALARLPYGATTLALKAGLQVRQRLFGGRRMVNERIIEYGQILRWLPDSGTVLDIGCVTSRFPIELASLGYKVHGLDTRPYPFQHPNFTFHQSDFFKWSPPAGQRYDVVLLISAIEHFGLGSYGDIVMPNADRDAVTRIGEWLTPNGHFIVTFPFGKRAVTPKYRVYDTAQVDALFAGFTRVSEAYYQRVNGAWMPSSAAALADVESLTMPANGVGLFKVGTIS